MRQSHRRCEDESVRAPAELAVACAVMPIPSLALAIAHAAATLFMCGLIWFVQVAHYPLFTLVGEHGYGQYQQQHMRLTTWVVGPPMLIETATALALWLLPPRMGPDWVHHLNIGLLAAIWASTVLLQVPCHDRLARGYDAAAHARLVRSNWIRTLAWTARAPIALGLLIQRAA